MLGAATAGTSATADGDDSATAGEEWEVGSGDYGGWKVW